MSVKTKKPRMDWKAKCGRQEDLIKQQQENYESLSNRCEQLKNDFRGRVDELIENHFNIQLDLDAKILKQTAYIKTLEASRVNLSDLLTVESGKIENQVIELAKQDDHILALKSKIEESVRYVGSVESSAQAFSTLLGDSVL